MRARGVIGRNGSGGALKSVLLPGATAAVLAAVVSCGPAVPSGAAGGAASPPPGQWRVSQRIAVSGSSVYLLSVAAVSGDDAWLIGLVRTRGRAARSYVAEWSGTGWRRVAVPGPVLAAFDSIPGWTGLAGQPFAVIGASSPGNVWAFSQANGAWLHYDGVRWSEGTLPTVTARSTVAISSTLVLGRRDVWAFGDRYTSRSLRPFAAHYDGRRWAATAVPDARAVAVTAASAVRPDDVWVTVGVGGGQGLFSAQAGGGALGHWDGRRWHLVPLPPPLRHGDPASVVAVSDRDLWVGGGVGQVWLGEALAHWDGSGWQILRRPAGAQAPGNCVLGGLAPGQGGLVALGECFTQDKPGLLSRLWAVQGTRWAGPAGLRAGSTSVVLGQMSGTPNGSVIRAVGWAGGVGVIAEYEPGSG